MWAEHQNILQATGPILGTWSTGKLLLFSFLKYDLLLPLARILKCWIFVDLIEKPMSPNPKTSFLTQDLLEKHFLAFSAFPNNASGPEGNNCHFDELVLSLSFQEPGCQQQEGHTFFSAFKESA